MTRTQNEVLQENMKRLLGGSSLSNRAIARIAQISPATITNITQGRAIPAADVLYRLAVTLDTTVEWLLEDHSND